jgi:hypothetical protein
MWLSDERFDFNTLALCRRGDHLQSCMDAVIREKFAQTVQKCAVSAPTTVRAFARSERNKL